MRARAWTFIALWGVAALFLGIIAAITSSVLRLQRTDAIEQGQSRATLAAAGAETLVNRTFLGVDVLLAGLEDLVTDHGLGMPDRQMTQRLLAGVAKRNLFVRDLVLVDEDGNVLEAAMQATKRLGVKLPSTLLQATFQRAAPSLAMSAPSDNFASAETVFFFSRRFLTGGPGGIAAVAVVPESQIAAALSPGGPLGGLTITLERQDGQLVSSAPPSGLPASRRAAQPIPLENRDGMARQAVGRTDGSPSIVASRSLLHDDLVVAASVPLAPLMSGLEDARRSTVAVSVLLGLVVVMTAGVTHWFIRKLDRARQDIERGKTWLDQALASMRDGLLLCNETGRVVAWNARYLEFFPWVRPMIAPGVPYEALLRATLDHLVPDEEADRREALLQHRLKEHRRGVTSAEYQITEDLRLHVAESRTDAGGVVSVYRDVTSTERELKRARQAEAAAEEARAEFVEAVAKQVSQPANNVLGMTDLLLRSALEDRTKRYVAWAREAATEILVAIDDLLQMSRLRGEAPMLSFAEFELGAVVDEAVHQAQFLAERSGGQLRLQDRIPPIDKLWGDSERVRHVLFQVFRAAIESAPRQSLVVTVETKSTPEGRILLWARVRRERQAIASASARSAGTNSAEAGAVALEIARRLVQMMAGRIDWTATGDNVFVVAVEIPFELANSTESTAQVTT